MFFEKQQNPLLEFYLLNQNLCALFKGQVDLNHQVSIRLPLNLLITFLF